MDRSRTNQFARNLVTRMDRRRALQGVGVTLAAALLTRPMPTAAQEATPAAPLMGETFVGETSDADAFVAVVVAEPQAGEEARQVRAYLCDAAENVAWFTGSASGEEVELSSEDGARLTAALTPAAVSGEITLANGGTLTFEAAPATGVAGLYTITLTDEGMVRGAAVDGQAQLEGLVAAAPLVAPDAEDGHYPIVLTIRRADGEAGAILGSVSASGAAEGRLIVLPDGRSKGTAGCARCKGGGQTLSITQ
jgi:hypothetical protein